MSAAIKTLLLAHHAGKSSATGQAIAHFAGEVERRSGGLLNVADLPASTLGNLPALLRMVMSGEADMAFAPFDRLSELIPKFGCVGLPFVFDDLAHADRVLNGPFADWATPDLRQYGLHSLSSWEWGRRQLTNNVRPLHHPDQARGLRIRVPPIYLYQEAMLALGALPVIVEFSRLQSVLQQGLVDGQENPVAIIHEHRLHEQQRYLSLLDYSYGAMLHLINRRSFEALSIEQQQILGEESQRAGQLMRQTLREQEARQLAELEAAGMLIERPASTPFREAMAGAHLRLAELYGPQRCATFMEMLAHLRQPDAGNAP